jgi:GT2 family glycosyltransferase
MPYYDREPQLRATLKSFSELYQRNDFEVIVIEDQKQTPGMTVDLLGVLDEFIPFFTTQYIKSQAGICYNPATAYNEGAKAAQGEFLVLTNPECRHDGDVLKGFDSILKEAVNSYIICSCKALKKDNKFHMWYQHSLYRAAQYHFCSCIKKEVYWQIGGFNEAYTQGYGYDDNSFLGRVQASSLKIVQADELQVTHLWHQKVQPPNYRELLQRNRTLFEKEFGVHV